MKKTTPFRIHVPYFIKAILIGALLLSGCALPEIQEQAQITEDAGTLKGKVNVKSDQIGPVIVLRFRRSKGVLVLDNKKIVSDNGEFSFTVMPDTYYVAAFIDANQDGKYQEGEHGNYYGNPSEISVKPNQTVKVKPIVISGIPPIHNQKVKSNTQYVAATKNIGRVVGMNDPLFVRDNYAIGLWRPLDFLKEVGGGLLFLQEFQADKIPVIFVHGINGGPKDWGNVIEKLDKDQFQPWVVYYPSGLRLDMVSDYLVQALSELQNKYQFKQVNVVAHSMGGLVTRSFIKKYVEQFPDASKNIRMVMTINSPMMGMPSATMGVKHSPIVVSSWRDVAAGSDFLNNIHAWNWPSNIPYTLVFSYESGEGDDGVVSLQSQIPLKLQSEAVRMYGFNNSHVGTLHDDAFLNLFNSVMAGSAK